MSEEPAGRQTSRRRTYHAVNSPSDVAFDERDVGDGDLSFSTTLLTPTFTAANSVTAGRHPSYSRPFTPAATARSRARKCSST